MITCYIGLGSNLGDSHANIRLALKYLEQDPGIHVVKISSLIKTKPHDCPPQPDFLNGVAKIETNYSTRQLLNKLQEIEVKLGRVIPRIKNSPRTIDLDILTFGDLKIDDQDLQVPHPLMWQRKFVTMPLRQVAPELFTKV